MNIEEHGDNPLVAKITEADELDDSNHELAGAGEGGLLHADSEQAEEMEEGKEEETMEMQERTSPFR